MTTSNSVPMCGCGCGGPGDFSRGMCAVSYKRYRRRQIAYGRWQPRVPADAARGHVAALIAVGLRPEHVAGLAGISPATVHHITHATSDRISAEIERAVLAVEIPDRPGDVAADNAFVPIIGARRRIQALVAYGYPQAHLARELGMNPAHTTMAALVGRINTASGATGQTINAKRERQIKELFDRLQLVPGPSDRARAHGRRHGWPLPFEWDEDSIDRPDAKPTRSRWTFASARAERRDQVQQMSQRGLPNWQIAHELRITKRTVERIRHAAPTGIPEQPQTDWGLDR
ncbi:helix-turn-helix domain-containing protein [Nocardia sp. CDC153]|uniref:helix-turn-helix domain-containing protein n=1 Tax=Nocardia sp. CDC153 TaxID=3112167 RepID=UPI002DB699FF|nr:helix-turn-helix domain-containing protein [Nocardia sp. CDC153]MEC3957534.1 helix-turn-helix domain-containing protein [Nocardia sp. CDC153]